MRTRHMFGMADLGRSGLGNKLFPHVRCMLWCRGKQVPMLPSRFVQFRLGPILRGERDWRFYGGLFERPALTDLALRATLPRLLPVRNEVSDQEFHSEAPRLGIYRFAGLGDYFRTLNGRHEEVLPALTGLLAPQWRDYLFRVSPAPVGIHVRLGDFTGNILHPIEWYVEALRLVRSIAGWVVPAKVFSDGTEKELARLLAIESVQRVEGPNAITDLLHLAKSRFLIGTGSSTFGAWAAYLGQMPALTRTGNPFSWWNLVNQRGYHIGEVDVAAAPSTALIPDVARVLGERAVDAPN